MDLTDDVIDYTVFIGIAIFIFLYLLHRRYGIEIMTTEKLPANDEKSETERRVNDLNYCGDQACVRCNKYGDTLSSAFTRLACVSEKQIADNIQEGLNPDCSIDCPQKPNVFFYKSLNSTPVWETADIPDTKVMENAFEGIQTEFKFLIAHQESGLWKKNRTPSGSWDVFHIINQGELIQENAELCPFTLSVVNSLQSSLTKNVFGNVLFSVIKPGTLITEHYGPTNIRLRCHLGLAATQDCVLIVDDQTTLWAPGKCLVFDDSFLHSVSHFGDSSDKASANTKSSLLDRKAEPHTDSTEDGMSVSDRAVLIVDLWHPNLTEDERKAIDIVFAP